MAFLESLIIKLIAVGISVLVLHKVLQHFDEDISYKHSLIVAGTVGFIEFILGLFSFPANALVTFFVSLYSGFFILRHIFRLTFLTSFKIIGIWYPLYFILGMIIVTIIQLM